MSADMILDMLIQGNHVTTSLSTGSVWTGSSISNVSKY